MAFHHRSSASFSSLSLSRTSLASSSESSPASSPDSANPPSLPSHSCGIIVPFSWEEKPGVLKKDITASSRLAELSAIDASPSTFHCAGGQLRAERVLTAGHENLQSSRTLLRQPAAPYGCKETPQVQLPPYLSHNELQARVVAGSEATSLLSSSCKNDHYAAAGAGSKIMASLSRQKRRPHRRRAALEDDPFWLAMVACTNDAGKAPEDRRNGKSFLASKVSRTDPWLTRKVQESIHLDRCMPRHGQYEDPTLFKEIKIHSRQCKATCQITNKSANSDQSCGKTVKAQGMAKAELQDECRARSHHHGPPVVDISCRSHRAALAKLGLSSKQKLP